MTTTEPADGWPKPLDVGNGQVCASFAADGSWLSLGRVHPRHGFVELTGAPAFAETWRGDPDSVRRYRRSLTLADNAVLRLTGDVPGVVPDSTARGWSDVSGAHRVEAWAAAEHPAVVQWHLLRAGSNARPRRLTLVFRGRVQRPPFAEITDVSPLPPLPSRPSATAAGTVLWVAEPVVGSVARVLVTVTGASTSGWQVDVGATPPGDDVGARTARLAMSWDPGLEPTLEVTVTCLLTGPEEQVPLEPPLRARTAREQMSPDWLSGRSAPPVWRSGHPARPHVPSRLRADLARLIEGTSRYVLGCTALAAGPGERCIITDHRLLPLSWTRDAYYQALLLLAVRDVEPRALGVVADHLRWLWRHRDPDTSGWMRSHLPNGEVKDRAMQADQQLYPVLELLDYADSAGELPAPPTGSPGWGPLIAQTWRALTLDPELGLISGEENPADDPSSLPYQLSSQILLWYVATRLAARERELDLGGLGLTGLADRVQASIRSQFRCTGPFGVQWAYETDGRGAHRLYHDANDLPTVLAPLWGLCSPHDPAWLATMRFAFDPANPGWSAGRWGGLGSAHTAGTWPLGDVQEWITASLLGDTGRAERVLERLLAVAAPDGLLPETYDPDTGAWLARHWFAWPSAFLGVMALSAAEVTTPGVRP